jgi:hypothetical protein
VKQRSFKKKKSWFDFSFLLDFATDLKEKKDGKLQKIKETQRVYREKKMMPEMKGGLPTIYSKLNGLDLFR